MKFLGTVMYRYHTNRDSLTKCQPAKVVTLQASEIGEMTME